jgi:hypothetical protein
MKKQKPTKSDMGDVPTLSISHERYPYGLQIRLGTDELEKLGIDVTDMKAGQMFEIKGMCCACEVRNNEVIDEKGKSKKDQSLELQIQKLALASQDSFKGGFEEDD